MPTLQVVAAQPLAGKSMVAVALAQAASRSGWRVQLVRAGAGTAAEADAATFAAYLFASTPGRAVATTAVAAGAASDLVIVELDAGETLPGVPALVVVRGRRGDADAPFARALGDRLLGTVATRIVAPETEQIARDLTNSDMRPLALLPEDAALAAPSVEELRAALGAELLFDAENGDVVVEDVLIAPVYADPARPHFRRFASKAILAPFNKTDLHLAAIETQAACLVITGGHRPSPYVLDRAQHDSTTVLLAPRETPETVGALDRVWLTSRFRGDRKAQSAHDQLIARLDVASLLKKLG